MKKLAISLAALAIASPALAADLGDDLKGGDPITVPANPLVNWTGAYAGGQIGWVNGSHEASLDTPGGTLLELDGIAGSGVIGGGRIGFDVARGLLLLGAFADYNFTDAETTLDVLGNTALSVEKDDEWTAGIRAGYLIAPRTLVYGLVGYTQTSYSFNVPGGGVDVDFDGITAGGGVEVAVGSGVFLGLEASHTFYDNETVLPLGGGARIADELDETRVLGTVKFKLNGIGL